MNSLPSITTEDTEAVFSLKGTLCVLVVTCVSSLCVLCGERLPMTNAD
jgi:hypothetical protein